MRVINNIKWLYLYSFNMLNLLQSLSFLFTITMDPFLLPNTLWLFFSLTKDILSIKFRLELVRGRVLWGGLIMRWRGRRKTILEVVLPSCLLMITTPFFAKSLLKSLIMLFKPQNPSIPLSLISFHLKLSEKHWRRLVFTQQQRSKFLCWRLAIGNKCSSLQISWKLDCEGLEECFMKWWD